MPINSTAQRYHPPTIRPYYLLEIFFRELTGVWEKFRHVSPGMMITNVALTTTGKSL